MITPSEMSVMLATSAVHLAPRVAPTGEGTLQHEDLGNMKTWATNARIRR
ncbi:MAG TPA: hypothetical protein VJT72_03745 [Pseudonocardiaceae bacterium]|nr:hypothetical protein [Pseudonocardiaceae bacterium]